MTFRKMVALLLAAALLLGGCDAKKEPKDGFVVYASFAVIGDFVKKIVTEDTEVHVLVPPGMEPHDWEPTPQDMVRMSNADMIVLNGAGMENWMEKLKVSLPDVPVLELTPDDFAEVHDHDHDHDHDPHVWLSPQIAIEQVLLLQTALLTLDAKNAIWYTAQYDAFTKEINALELAYHMALNDAPHKTIVVAHEAYGYLCAEYGLTQVAVAGLSPEDEPSLPRVAEIIDQIRAEGITHIFYEGGAPSKTTESIANETGVKLLPLSTLEFLAEGEDYFSVMYANLESLKEALCE